MIAPVILYVDTERRAAVLQHAHDPDVMRVRRIGSCHGDRASAIIVELPFAIRNGVAPEPEKKAFEAWMEWVPTRLIPGERGRITIL
jgi:hypothetical protein